MKVLRNPASKASLICSLLLLLNASSTWACSCIRQSVKEDFQDADVVFSGKVLNRGEPESQTKSRSWELIEVKFELDETWKGEKTANITVSTELMSISCGYPFREGNSYVVFAKSKAVADESGDGENEILYTNWCVSNQKIDETRKTRGLFRKLKSLKSKHEREVQRKKDREGKNVLQS